LLTCDGWSQKVPDALAHEDEAVGQRESLQRDELHQDDGREGEGGREEDAEEGAGHHEGPVGADEERHGRRRQPAHAQAEGVRLGHVHPWLVARPPQADLQKTTPRLHSRLPRVLTNIVQAMNGSISNEIGCSEIFRTFIYKVKYAMGLNLIE